MFKIAFGPGRCASDQRRLKNHLFILFIYIRKRRVRIRVCLVSAIIYISENLRLSHPSSALVSEYTFHLYFGNCSSAFGRRTRLCNHLHFENLRLSAFGCLHSSLQYTFHLYFGNLRLSHPSSASCLNF